MKTVTFVVLTFISFVIALKGETRYRVVRIDSPFPDEPYATMIGAGINNLGEVVGGYSGYTSSHSQWSRAIYYSDSTGTLEIEMPAEWDGGAGDINDAGQIVIAVMDTERRPGQDWAFRYTPGVGLEWLVGFGGKTTEPAAINALGQVAGSSDTLSGEPYAFRYTDGLGLTNLGGLFGEGSSGLAINDRGWVAGASAEHAFLFRDDVGMLDLGPGIAYGINNVGWVVGRAFVTDGHPFTSDEAFLYREGQRQLLGRLSGSAGAGSTSAWDINNHGVVVGWANIFDYPSALNPRVAGMIWTEQEGMRELNELIDPNSRLYVTEAMAINDYGQITGYGSFTNGAGAWDPGLTFRLDPIPPKLSIQRGSTNLAVHWSSAWPGIALEATDDLRAPHWQPVATGGTNVVALPLEGGARFFRLNLEAIRGLCCAPQ